MEENARKENASQGQQEWGCRSHSPTSNLQNQEQAFNSMYPASCLGLDIVCFSSSLCCHLHGCCTQQPISNGATVWEPGRETINHHACRPLEKSDKTRVMQSYMAIIRENPGSILAISRWGQGTEVSYWIVREGSNVGADPVAPPLPWAGEHVSYRILVAREELCFVRAGECHEWNHDGGVIKWTGGKCGKWSKRKTTTTPKQTYPNNK